MPERFKAFFGIARYFLTAIFLTLRSLFKRGNDV